MAFRLAEPALVAVIADVTVIVVVVVIPLEDWVETKEERVDLMV